MTCSESLRCPQCNALMFQVGDYPFFKCMACKKYWGWTLQQLRTVFNQ